MSKNIIITSKSHNPWHNLALEEFLFDHIEDDTRILYLWQNSNTVVIGKLLLVCAFRHGNQAPLKIGQR